MSDQFKLGHSSGAYPKQLALFTAPVTDVATYRTDYVEYSSKNPLEDRRLLFHLEGIRNQMIKLNGIKLYFKGKIQYENGTDVPDIPSGTWSTEELTDVAEEVKRKELQEKLKAIDVFPVNNLYHSLFKDGTMSIQNVKMFSNDIAYRGLIDTAVNHSFNAKDKIMSQFYIPPEGKATADESSLVSHPNVSKLGFAFASYTKKSNEIELCGDLLFPLCQQDKLLLSHVDVKIELIQHYPEFYLRHPHGDKKFKFVITGCKLIVPLITLPPDVEIGLEEVLKTNPAVYAYNDKRLTVHSVASGSRQFDHINTWNGDVPSKLSILMLPSANYNGSLETDPYCFEHNKITDAYISVDNLPVGGKGMSLTITDDQHTSQIIDAYCAAVDNFPNMGLTRSNWVDNFPILHFNINSNYTEEVLPLIKKGVTKVYLKFSTDLPQDTVILMLAEFPALLEIDGARNVTL